MTHRVGNKGKGHATVQRVKPLSFLEWRRGYIDWLYNTCTVPCLNCSDFAKPFLVNETCRADLLINLRCPKGHESSKIVYHDQLKKSYRNYLRGFSR